MAVLLNTTSSSFVFFIRTVSLFILSFCALSSDFPYSTVCWLSSRSCEHESPSISRMPKFYMLCAVRSFALKFYFSYYQEKRKYRKCMRFKQGVSTMHKSKYNWSSSIFSSIFRNVSSDLRERELRFILNSTFITIFVLIVNWQDCH